LARIWGPDSFWNFSALSAVKGAHNPANAAIAETTDTKTMGFMDMSCFVCGDTCCHGLWASAAHLP
jgi:hypothetical protein